MKKIITILFVISFMNIFSQESIIYNVKENKFYLNKMPITKNSLLVKNTDYQLAFKNYNPFYYNYETTIKSKDDIKDFFEFITKLQNIKVEDLEKIRSNTVVLQERNEENKNLTANFLASYEVSYLISEDLKLSDFNTKDFNERIQKTDFKKLLEKYIAIKKYVIDNPQPNEDAETTLKKMGMPTQADVEKMYKLMNNLNEVLEIYKQNNDSFPTDNINSGINSRLILEVALTPKDEKESSIKKTQIFNIKSCVLVNFSSGIFMSWNAKKSYYSTKNSNDKYNINIESERAYLPGVSVLGNLLYSQNPNIGIVVGAGLDIEATPSFLTGISYKFKNSNIIISSGIGFSHQDKLSDKFSLNNEYDEAPSLTYKKTVQNGFWFGVSYKI